MRGINTMIYNIILYKADSMKLQVKNRANELYELMNVNGYSPQDIEAVREALDFAAEKHADQKRKSGEPYIIHPIATSTLLVK